MIESFDIGDLNDVLDFFLKWPSLRNCVSDDKVPDEARHTLSIDPADFVRGIVNAQQAQAAMSKKIDALEKELTAIKDWEAEAARYQMFETQEGSIVFQLDKEQLKPGELEHDICPNCYGKRKKSILQAQKLAEGGLDKKCVECDVTYRFRPMRLSSRLVSPSDRWD